MEKAVGGGSLGAFASFGQSLPGSEAIDVDGYVTSKALDGLFKMVAQESSAPANIQSLAPTICFRQCLVTRHRGVEFHHSASWKLDTPRVAHSLSRLHM